MSDDVFSLRLEGEAARTFTPALLAAIQGIATMSETAAQLRAAYTANAETTAALAQAFETFRTQQQTRLEEALARVETEVAARVQVEADRDAIRAVVEEARAAIEADTARETEMLTALTAGATTPPVTPPVETPPTETPPVVVDTVPAVDPATGAPVVATDPATVPVAVDPATGAPVPAEETPPTNGIGQSFAPPA